VDAVTDVRLGPFSDADQRNVSFALTVSPHGSVRRYADGFGNTAHLVSMARPHASAEIMAKSETETFLRDPFQVPMSPPQPLGATELADYLAPSPRVPAVATIGEIAAATVAQTDVFARVQAMNRFVYEGFGYEKDATTVSTPLEEVLVRRVGVCQDFTHVLIGLCRAAGIPARYVSGYIAPAPCSPAGEDDTAGDAASPRRGAQASHAWVEAFIPTHGWRGFDPTNNLVANDQFVKMAVGRDYHDVPPTRGVFRGTGQERLEVEVVTAVLDGGGQKSG
jgi:transglutaminase-like putative cysteine protease